MQIGDYWMTGTIDEVVSIDRALSDAEIGELMDKGIIGALDVKPGGKLVIPFLNNYIPFATFTKYLKTCDLGNSCLSIISQNLCNFVLHFLYCP